MSATMLFDQQLPQPVMAKLTEEVRGVTRKLSREQLLDLADMLHEAIRERQFEERSWVRLHDAVDRAG